jgi:hypothetical protein
MKLKYIVLFVFIFAAFSGACSSKAKATPYPDLLQYVRANTSIDFPKYRAPEIRIWGWAQNGRVAYSSEWSIGATGGIAVEFVVFDFINDRRVFTLGMDDYEIDWTGVAGDLAEALYAKYDGQIRGAMERFAIVEQQVPFLPFPLKKNNAVYTASVNIMSARRADPANFVFNSIVRYNILVAKNEKSRIITTKNNADAEAVAVCGYFLSPFEDRILVVIANAHGSFRDSNISYSFSGCHLEAGF